jgi:hypothetical protein
MHILMCLISGAQRKPRFSQATLKKAWIAFFNFPVRTGDCEGSSGDKPLPNQRQANETLVVRAQSPH